MRGGIAVVSLLLLAACGTLPEHELPVEHEVAADPATPSEAIGRVQQLNRQGDRIAALNILRAAGRDYPDNPNIKSLLEKMEASWLLEKRLLQDRMLVIEVRALLQREPLLKQLSEGDPDNYLTKSRLLFWRQYLQLKHASLLSCAETEQEIDLALTRDCLELAQAISPSDETRRRLADVDSQFERRRLRPVRRERERAVPESAPSVPEQVEEKQRQRMEVLLQEAERDIRQGSLTRATIKLEEALKQDPQHPRTRALIAEVEIRLASRVQALIELGDRLYRDQQIGPAVAVWEAAVKLKPDQEQIVQKIDRARKVLERLDEIRARELEAESGGEAPPVQ